MCGGHPRRAGLHAPISHHTPLPTPAGQEEGKYLKGDEAAAKEGILRPGRCREHGESSLPLLPLLLLQSVTLVATTPPSCCWVTTPTPRRATKPV